MTPPPLFGCLRGLFLPVPPSPMRCVFDVCCRLPGRPGCFTARVMGMVGTDEPASSDFAVSALSRCRTDAVLHTACTLGLLTSTLFPSL